MKKITLTVMILVMCTAFLIGCSDQSDDAIVGTWTLTTLSEDGTELSVEDYLKSAELDTAPQLTFEGNGKVKLDTGETSGTATWKNENGAYAITDNSGDDPVIMELTVDGDQLSMSQNGFDLTYQKQ